MAKGVTVSTKDLGIGQIDDVLDKLETAFLYAGEESISEARSETKENDWENQTGNLRSSIGFVVLKDGKPLQQSKPQAFSGKKGDGSQGVAEGQALLETLSSGGKPNTLTLSVVAGMEYASYVESRGYNVLTSAQLKAEESIKDAIEDILS